MGRMLAPEPGVFQIREQEQGEECLFADNLDRAKSDVLSISHVETVSWVKEGVRVVGNTSTSEPHSSFN